MYNWNIRTNLDHSEMFDLEIPRDEILQDICNINSTEYMAIDVDVTNSLTSKVIWDDAVISGGTLEHLYLTGFDNFLIDTPEDYNSGDINTEYVYDINEVDKFKFFPVSGHTTTLEYNITTNPDDSLKLDGGFLQGYYRINEYPLEFFPKRVQVGWTVDMIIKNTTSGTTSGTTLNDIYPANSGFIFYMGTRSENKFDNTPQSGTTLEEITALDELDFVLRDTTVMSDLIESSEITYSFYNNPYLPTASPDSLIRVGDRSSYLPESFNDPATNFWPTGTTGSTYNLYDGEESDVYGGFKLGYTYRNVLDEDYNRYYHTNGNELEDGEGVEYIGFYHFIKGIPYSERAHTEASVILYDLFPEKDIVDNAFGIRITDDGRIGYRKITIIEKECIYTKNIKKYYNTYRSDDVTVEEGYSCRPIYGYLDEENINVTISFRRDVPLDECELETNIYLNGTLKIYVNGVLVFKDTNFREVLTRELIELSELQETVPFNISWGGGSQGLYENVTFGGPDVEDLGKLIERHFGGSFIGDLHEFQMYTRPLNFTEIRHNFAKRQEQYGMNFPII